MIYHSSFFFFNIFVFYNNFIWCDLKRDLHAVIMCFIFSKFVFLLYVCGLVMSLVSMFWLFSGWGVFTRNQRYTAQLDKLRNWVFYDILIEFLFSNSNGKPQNRFLNLFDYNKFRQVLHFSFLVKDKLSESYLKTKQEWKIYVTKHVKLLNYAYTKSHPQQTCEIVKISD